MQRFSVPGHGSLLLNVPKEWRVAVHALQDPASAAVRFRPASGDAFSVQVTAVWIDPGRQAKVTPESIKETVRDGAAERDLLLAIETAQGEQRYLQLLCRRYTHPGEAGVQGPATAQGAATAQGPATAQGTVLILAADVTALEGTWRAQEEDRAWEVTALREARTRLEERVRWLEATNEQLSAANAELCSANEALLLGNEHLQAALEEVETLNAEMQAAIEELHTANDELEACPGGDNSPANWDYDNSPDKAEGSLAFQGLDFIPDPAAPQVCISAGQRFTTSDTIVFTVQ